MSAAEVAGANVRKTDDEVARESHRAYVTNITILMLVRASCIFRRTDHTRQPRREEN
jgi:hypothetical protein